MNFTLPIFIPCLLSPPPRSPIVLPSLSCRPPFVHSLAASSGSYLFLRPPRFGKTRLLHALHSLFTTTPHPVITLDFAELPPFTARKAFGAHFETFLEARFSQVGFTNDARLHLNFFEALRLWLAAQPASSLVVFIDNYDAPLAAALSDADAFRAVSATLAKFFALLKSQEGRLRLLLLTGVLKLADETLQPAFNYLTDLTYDAQAAKGTGLTSESIKPAELQRAAETLGLTPSDLLTELNHRYGGFAFDFAGRHRVLAPEPVLQLLQHPERGLPSLAFPNALRRSLTDALSLPPNDADAPKAVTALRFDAFQHPGALSAEALLAQAGLLTVEKRLANGISLLTPPNAFAARELKSLCHLP